MKQAPAVFDCDHQPRGSQPENNPPIWKYEAHTNDVGDLYMSIGSGNVVVRSDNNKIDFLDIASISIEDLEYTIREAKAFIEYRDTRRKDATLSNATTRP